jgi:hypothetical protein
MLGVYTLTNKILKLTATNIGLKQVRLDIETIS